MVKLERACHSVYKIRYHMVFCVKYRKKLLYESDKIDFLKYTCSEIEQRYSFVFDAIGTDGDHVHIFVGAAPRYAPSKIMQIIKSIVARELFKKYPEIKKQLWGGHFWSEGGYIGTVGDGVTSDIVKDYINRQGAEEERESSAQLSSSISSNLWRRLACPDACIGVRRRRLTGRRLFAIIPERRHSDELFLSRILVNS